MRLSLLLLISAGALHGTQSASTPFQDATAAYAAGKFEQAAAGFESMLAPHGASAAVHLNLAHAYYRMSAEPNAATTRFGRAIHHYQLASRLAPRDGEIHRALQAARARVHGQAPRPAPAHVILGHFTLNEWTLAASLAVTGWSLLLALCRLWRDAQRVWIARLRPWLPVLGVAGLVLVTATLLAWREQSWIRRGVAVHDTQVFKRPLAPQDVPDQVPHADTDALRDGIEVTVLEERDGGWLRVRFADGMNKRAGWVRTTVGAGDEAAPHILLLPR